MEYRFEDILEIRNGKNQKAVENPEGRYPIYGSGGVIGYADDYICEADTIIIGRKGSINNPIYVSEPFWNVDTAFGLSVKKDFVLPKYLYYFCKKFDFGKLNKTVTIPSLTKSDLLKIKINVPVKEEQQAIIDKLMKIESIMAFRKIELDYLDVLIKARFVEMFVKNEYDWKEVTIAEVCIDMRTGPFGSSLHHDEFVDKGVFVLGIDNAVENTFSYNRMRYITEEKYEKLKRYTVYPGDVIITIMGTVGKAAVIPKNMPKAINTKHLACLTPNTEIVDSYFLVNAFQIHPLIRHQLESQCKGAIMDGLNVTIIKGLKFKLPPIKLQRKFVEFYNQVNKSKVTVQKALEETQILFDSLMQKYFG